MNQKYLKLLRLLALLFFIPLLLNWVYMFSCWDFPSGFCRNSFLISTLKSASVTTIIGVVLLLSYFFLNRKNQDSPLDNKNPLKKDISLWVLVALLAFLIYSLIF